MKENLARLLLFLSLLVGCKGGDDFTRAFKIQIPAPIKIEHQYLYSRWDTKEVSYYAVLKGSYNDFLYLVRELNLYAAGAEPLAFPVPNVDKAPWWNPPTIEEIIATASNQYCWSKESSSGWERVIAQYMGTNILLYKYGPPGIGR